jgi:hypothetical protein
LAILLAAMPFVARAQTFQALPEIDAYYRFDPNWRVYFQAKDTREGGARRIQRKSDPAGTHEPPDNKGFAATIRCKFVHGL